MYKAHPVLTVPEPSAKIWRYVNFAKFVDMLQRRALYFSQLGLLGDPFEGMPSEGVVERHRHAWEQVREMARNSGMTVDFSPDYPPHRLAHEDFRLWTYVNCWNMGDFESLAMWQLYSREGIAIQSTFERLAGCFVDELPQVSIGQVTYRDRRGMSEEQVFEEFMGGPLASAFRKGMSYQHEQELRAHVLHDARPEGQTAFDLEKVKRIQPPGIPVSVDLETLIEAIYVAPKQQSWFKELVERELGTYSISKPVITSDLDERPSLT